VIRTTQSRAAAGFVALSAMVLGAIALADRSSGDGPSPSAGARSQPLPADDGARAGVDSGPSADTAPALPEPPPLPDRGVHPELRDIDGWLQSDVTSLEELRGQVVAVQFWTFGCRNCKATLPHMQALDEKYGLEEFEIVGIHAPEFDHEADVDNIAEAATDLGVTWPIVLDTQKRTFHHWQEGPRAFWPRIYLLDRAGHVR
jgi:thiol-disulfide isomerase/thioredoxin